MTDTISIALRTLVFPVAFAAILACVQLRVEVGQRAPEIAQAAKVAASDFNGFVNRVSAALVEPSRERIKIASR